MSQARAPAVPYGSAEDAMPRLRAGPPHARRRSGVFHRESTRLRSNVADQVQRDLLPAGRMLLVFLVLCELLAEVAVLVWSRGQPCDRPLRFWVAVLMLLQVGTILLRCLNIWHGRDSLGHHRNGLSATDLDMYVGSPQTTAPLHSTAASALMSVSLSVSTSAPSLSAPSPTSSQSLIDIASVMVDSGAAPSSSDSLAASPSAPAAGSAPAAISAPATPATRSSSPFLLPHAAGAAASSASSSATSTMANIEFVDRYVRIVNAWYLVWFILGSVWVSDGGTCPTTAPHLYRLIVALTIIYYALLFLPLACFCLIVCCLPLFILVYRIMLPYAERERRRARAADPAQVQNLNAVPYSPATFANLTGSDSLEDASCVICLCDYEQDESIRFLPCKHHFHKDCVDVWLRLDKACCLCKQDIDAQANAVSSAV